MAVERGEKLFSMFDMDNDGDITEEEFLRVCLEDEEMVTILGTKTGMENGEKKEEDKGKWNPDNPRLSQSAEFRNTTKRRYSDLCARKKL